MSFRHESGDSELLAMIRLAVANFIGFSASTIVPLWLGDISSHLGRPAWYGGLVATLQLSACALMNVATPLVFRKGSPVPLGRAGLILAGAGSLTASFPNPAAFLAGAVVAGVGLGVLLNSTNRLAARFHDVQSAYSIFQIVEVCLAASLFLTAGILARRVGLGSVFMLCAGLQAIGAFVLPAIESPPVSPGIVPAAWQGAIFPGAALALLALLIFFVGQSSINSFMIPIGRETGLSESNIGLMLAAGMLSGLAGAVGARVLGERIGLTLPVLAVALLLAATFVLLTNIRSPALFMAAAVLLPCGTIWVVPYFFTGLAKLDPSGRIASVGPAFLLSGVALGPTVAVFTRGHFGARAQGLTAASAVGLAAPLFLRSRPMTRSDEHASGPMAPATIPSE